MNKRLSLLLLTSISFTVFSHCKKDQNEQKLPALTTIEVTAILNNSALSGGNITDDGGATVTMRGVCWSTNPNPSTTGNKTSDGSGGGSFISIVTNLQPNTSYFLRAYATNKHGTAYGMTFSFTTNSDGASCPGIPTITDIGGNVYSTVLIGNQCWMRENLKYLPSVFGSGSSSVANPRYYVYGYEGTNVDEAKSTENFQNYGVLYNWSAALISCPTGWHLPSDAEWSQLTDYLFYKYGIRNTDTIIGAGNAIKSCRQVNSPLGEDCITDIHPRWDASDSTYGIDEFNFSGLPGGIYYTAEFMSIGKQSYWWTSTSSGTNISYRRRLGINTGILERYSGALKGNGNSIRCIKDSN